MNATTAAEPHSLEAERAVLGAILLSHTIPASVLDAGLQPFHFYRDEHAQAYSKMLALYDKGDPIDEVTMGKDGDRYLVSVPSVANLDSYVRTVLEKHRLRELRQAGFLLLEGVDSGDESKIASAEARIVGPLGGVRVYTRDKLRTLAQERMEAGLIPGYSIPIFERKLRPGTLTLVGGHTSHGKTVWVDQMVEHFNSNGLECWVWINEMTAEERLNRFLSKKTHIDIDKIADNDLSDVQKNQVQPWLAELPAQYVECPGWRVEDIARDIRKRSPDVAVLDIVHRIPHRDAEDLGHIVRVLGDAAKLSSCVVIATVHLNRKRTFDAARPRPAVSDIKGASSFEQDADNVMFVWRQDDDNGHPRNVGEIYFAKTRQGALAREGVVLDAERYTFEGTGYGPADDWDVF